MAGKMIKVTLVKSPIGCKAIHRECVKGLGLKRMHHTVEVIDTPSTRGLVNKVRYLLAVDGE